MRYLTGRLHDAQPGDRLAILDEILDGGEPREELPGQLALPGMPDPDALPGMPGVPPMFLDEAGRARTLERGECYRSALGFQVHGPGCRCPA